MQARLANTQAIGLVAVAASLMLGAQPQVAPPNRIDHPPRPEWPTWQQDDTSLALTKDGQTIWRFNYAPEDQKPHFHPLTMPGGEIMTAKSPDDHPWHRGLWWSWKYINGVNYWEEDRNTGESDGETTWKNVKIRTADNGEAEISLNLIYAPKGGDPVLVERRELHVSALDSGASYSIDWTATFTALSSDVTFDRTPLPHEKDGKAWGGYAGLSLRFALDMKERQAASAAGPIAFNEQNRHRSKASALDYSGMFGTNPNVAGVAIFDHPDNLNAPTPWYVIRSDVMSFFTPAVICYGPHTLLARESMTLRYRVSVHPGRWDAERLRAEEKRFVQAAKQREQEN